MGEPTTLDANPNPNSIKSQKKATPSNRNKKQERKKSERREEGCRTERKRFVKIGTWNVRRGLIKRENEITYLLQKEEVDILFITETDTKWHNVFDYKIKGFTTTLQAVKNNDDLVRVIAITRDGNGLKIETRQDLMLGTFPSIWFEIQDKNGSKSLIGGFYRQWSADGKLTVPEQVEQMEIFCNQINRAAATNCKIIITGDANLCSEKWGLDNYDRKSVAQPLQKCLEQNGIQIQNVGYTFQADRVCQNGEAPRSALDHVYNSLTITDAISVTKLPTSATDHVPVMIKYSLDVTKVRYRRSVTKRSYKGFTKESWNKALAQQDWSEVEESEDVDEMVRIFNDNVKAALDSVAPVKTFAIRSNHRFGLSESTKDLMKKRDRTRHSVQKATGMEKQVLIQQYKMLRNKVTGQIRKENIDHNNNRIKEANNERELWNVANDVLNPRKENSWNIINDEGVEIVEEKEVAETFNKFFINKVEELKKNIEPKDVEDPLVRLAEKMKNNPNKLEFKSISRNQLRTHLKKLKKKKSSGLDGLSQENLILGTENLLGPLNVIINQSIEQGKFPKEWKQAAVTPVLKKGNPRLLNNYRPVSCLPAASKVLEIVVCGQLSEYLEKNNLLPNNQHGFRPARSTMTAWQEIQLDWALKSEQKLVTGVLLWDLSAAFDTLDCVGLCKKLALFGVQPRSVEWVKSFLTGRSQKVKIGNKISSAKMVTSGVPQGGVLSPLIFVLFVSDLQDWLLHSTAPTYADDTTTGTSGTTLDETIKKLEEDAGLVLKYMASNGLVANPKKTSFLLLNCKQADPGITVRIGSDTVPRDSSAKLLGIQFQEDQQWKTQVSGKGGVLSGLRSRLYLIRRLKNHLGFRSILRLVDGIFMSKLRYGIQLLGKVRTTIEDPVSADFKEIQLIQNDLLRVLNGSKIKDMVSISTMLNKFNMLSANQINASIKLLEIWKALSVANYPLTIKRQEASGRGVSTRADQSGRLVEIGKSVITQKTSVSDAIRLWNKAPAKVTESKSLYSAKKEIKIYAKSLPV
jgi:hypothetical protein